MLKSLSDNSLINIIKAGEKASSPAISEIIKRHSGIFIDMINYYVPCSSPYCDKTEFIEEKDFYIYKAVMKFDETRGAKFSTHLGNEAKWLCLNAYNKAKNKQLFYCSDFEFDKEDPSSNYKEIFRKDYFKKILSFINQHSDERVRKIFTMRYIEGDKNKVMPWRKISDELSMSIQGCINIHNSTIETIKKKVLKEC